MSINYAYKNWQDNENYDFYLEFNRIESYNEYCKNWLNNYFGIPVSFTSKTNWNINDIVDIEDYNRVKTNINIILNALKLGQNLIFNQQPNQIFNKDKANEIEVKIKEYLDFLGNIQFEYNITGSTICGNYLKLGGGL